MFYTSTRNNNLKVSPMDALISGIASDGGLFVPETFPNPLNLKECSRGPQRCIESRGALRACLLRDGRGW